MNHQQLAGALKAFQKSALLKDLTIPTSLAVKSRRVVASRHPQNEFRNSLIR
jgi:hypothetical protein